MSTVLRPRVSAPSAWPRSSTSTRFSAEGVERAELRCGEGRFGVETHARLRTDPALVVIGLALVGISESVRRP